MLLTILNNRMCRIQHHIHSLQQHQQVFFQIILCSDQDMSCNQANLTIFESNLCVSSSSQVFPNKRLLIIKAKEGSLRCLPTVRKLMPIPKLVLYFSKFYAAESWWCYNQRCFRRTSLSDFHLNKMTQVWMYEHP